MGVSISENVAAVVSALLITVSSTIGIGDGVDTNRTLSGSASESITIGESTEEVTSGLFPSVSESISISTDRVVEVGDLVVEATPSSVIVSDSPTAVGGDPGVEVSNSVTIGENVNSNHALCPGVSESIPVADEPIADTGVTGPITISESIPVSEYEKTEVGIHIWVSDDVIVGRTSAKTSDSVVVGENVEIQFGYWSVSVSDSVALSDSAEGLVSNPGVSASESVAVTESIEALGGTNASVSDSLSVADKTPVIAVECNASASESISITDDCSAVFGDFSWLVEDEISVTEYTDVDIDLLPADGDITESISIGENTSVWIPLTVDKSESIPIGESQEIIVSGLAFSVSDSIPISELVDLDFSFEPSASESINIGESVEGLTSAAILSTSESVEIGEYVFVTGLGRYATSDSITVTESVNLLFSYPPTTVEKFGAKTHIRRIREWPYPDFGEFRL